MKNDHLPATTDLLIIGGGLAGLTAAALGARAGHQTLLLEGAASLGGRARSQAREGFTFNLGPHALYGSPLIRSVLAELAVSPAGAAPPVSGNALARYAGVHHPLPVTPLSFFRPGLLTGRARFGLLRLLAGLSLSRPEALESISLAAWLDQRRPAPAARAMIEALSRLLTYVHAPAEMSAGLLARMFQIYQRHGVRYLDGGWQALVDGVRRSAVAQGAELRAGMPAAAVQPAGSASRVTANGGQVIHAGAVILAVDPPTAARLLPACRSLQQAARSRRPVQLASLDVALSSLPRPERMFALDLDRPLYYSVHSAAARLAPPGGALLHIARYLAPGEAPESRALEEALAAWLDELQPGWQNRVVTRRFLPRLTVVNHLPGPLTGGLAGRPPVSLPDTPGVFLAGDWVGPDGWLAEAALASARAAALAAADHLIRHRPEVARRDEGLAIPAI